MASRFPKGALNAGAALTLSGASLADSSQSSAARFGGTLTSVDVAGAANIAGSVWGSGGALSVDAGSVSLSGANAKLYSGASSASSSLALRAHAGDLDLGDANITTPAQLFLESDQGRVLIGAGANPVQAMDIVVRAGVGVSNAGSVLAANSLSIDRSGGAAITLSNTGRLQGAAVTLGSAPGAVDLQNSASGSILADTLAVQAGQLRNSGLIQSTHGAAITASSFANDAASAKLLTSTQAGGSTSVITVSGAFDSAGTVNSATALQISAGNMNNATGGTLSSQSALALSAQDFTNSGSVESAGTLGLQTQSVTNSGRLEAAGTLDLQTQSVTNGGSVKTAGALNVGRKASPTAAAWSQLAR